MARIAKGKVLIADSTPVTSTTPYQHGITVSYFREVETEVEIPFQEEVIFQNHHLLVADKPHFLPVTPAGESVNECLLYRLQRRTGIADLAPLHRLDRDTAGLVLFSAVKAERRLYTQLFATRKVERKYLAVAAITEQADIGLEGGLREELEDGQEWTVANRLGPGDPWFRMKIVADSSPMNAITQISLKRVRGGLGLFELRPQTGKKHQLRIHLMSIGFPILNDCFYPELQFPKTQDYSRPLQLLAAQIRLQDPITGAELMFESKRELCCW